MRQTPTFYLTLIQPEISRLLTVADTNMTWLILISPEHEKVKVKKLKMIQQSDLIWHDNLVIKHFDAFN